MKDKATSPEHQEKPFLTEDDCGKLWESANAFFGSTGGVNPGAFKLGFEAAAKRANEKISSLESELKALREEREKLENDRDDFAIAFLKSMDLYSVENEPWIRRQLNQFKAYTLNTEKDG